jgi:Ribosomal protein L4/L1 family
VAFGPHPRDFSTELQRKVYDIAWRTALSYRYRKGELIIIDDKITIPRYTGGRLLSNIFEGNNWGKGNGRSLFVTNYMRERIFNRMKQVGEHGLVKDIFDVDVKDLLETGRIVIEKEALDCLLVSHASDLGRRVGIEEAQNMEKDAIVHAEGQLTLRTLFSRSEGSTLEKKFPARLLQEGESAREDEDDETTMVVPAMRAREQEKLERVGNEEFASDEQPESRA